MIAARIKADLEISRSNASFDRRSPKPFGALKLISSPSSVAIVPPNLLLNGLLDCFSDSRIPALAVNHLPDGDAGNFQGTGDFRPGGFMVNQ